MASGGSVFFGSTGEQNVARIQENALIGSRGGDGMLLQSGRCPCALYDVPNASCEEVEVRQSQAKGHDLNDRIVRGATP